MKNDGIRVAVAYARYSSNNQREESIDAQLRAIREYCGRNNIELLESFTDEAQSGKSDNRDGFQQMIKGILKGIYKTDAVLVHKFNRFARNQFESALNKKKLKEVGVRVISVTQNIENTPEGAMLESFLEAMDEYYSANLALEVRKGLRENALKGKHTGGRIPFGLSLSNGFYRPNKEALVVKRIFAEYASGEHKTDIVDRLNQEGKRNQFGRKFNVRTIYDMLRNEKYAGVFTYTINKKEIIRLDGIIEPIIDRELWEKVQARNNAAVQPRKNHTAADYLLTGKTFCGCCGSHISGSGSKRTSGGKLIKYYKCVGKTKQKNGCNNGSLNKEKFENSVFNAVVSAFSEENINHLAQLTFNELQSLRQSPEVSTESLKKEIVKLAAKQEKLTDLYLDGEIEKTVLNEKNTAIKKRKSEITAEIEKRKAAGEIGSINYKEVRQYIAEFFGQIKEGITPSDELRKSVFASLVEKIIVSADEISVYVKADFSVHRTGGSRKLSGAICRLPPAVIIATVRRTNKKDGA